MSYGLNWILKKFGALTLKARCEYLNNDQGKHDQKNYMLGLRLSHMFVNNFLHKQPYFHFSSIQSQVRFTGYYMELLE